MMIDGLLNAIVNFTFFGILVLIRKSYHKEGLDSFLIHWDKRGIRLFLEGLIVGIVFIGLYPVFITIFGFGRLTFDITKILNTIILLVVHGLGYLAVAVLEEALFRGYIFIKLVNRFSVPTALGISSIIFGGLHFMAYSGSRYFLIGLVNATLIGVLLCIVVIKTKSLMLAIGYHLTWNLGQRLMLTRGLSSINLELQSNILAGAGKSPETGLFVSLILILMAIYVFIRWRNMDEAKEIS